MIELARIIEAQLGVARPSDDPPTDLAARISESLNASDREQLGRFAGAVAWLDQVRDRIEQGKSHGSPGETIPTDSTWPDGRRAADKRESLPDSVPRQIGRFEIQRVIGQGGFARVFLARDPLLDRLVAVKVPNPQSIMSPEARARFEREARAASVLSHPNIVPVFETGSIGPVHYIASAWCAGQTLDVWFEKHQRRISPRSAAGIVACLAHAVEHAHQRGVIHRDLKPGNILFEKDRGPAAVEGDNGEPIAASIRIADFGLAKYETMDQFQTTEGAIVGTPAYMSPEQARGDRQVSAATDIWALGVILYELLTGQLPLRGNNHISTLQAIQSDDPKSPDKLRGDIPNDLQAICLKCLSKKPEGRYARAFDLQQDLENWLNGLPVQARRSTAMQRLQLWCHRNPALAASLAFALISLVLGLGVAGWKWMDAAAERNRSLESLYMAQDTIDDLVNDIIYDPNISGEKREQLVRQSIGLQEKLLHKSPNDTRVLLATIRVWRQLGFHLYETDQLPEAVQAVQHGRQLTDRLPPDSPERREFGKLLELDLAKITAKLDPPGIQPAGEMAEPPRNGNEWLIQSQKHHVAGVAMNRQHRYQEALSELERGMACLDHLPPDNVFVRDMRGRFLIDLGAVNIGMGNVSTADGFIHQALELFLPMGELMGSHEIVNEHLARCYLALGEIHAARQQWSQAEVEFGKARALYFDLHNRSPRVHRLALQLIYASQSMCESYYHKNRIRKLVDESNSLLSIWSEMLPETGNATAVHSAVISYCLLLAEWFDQSADAERCQEQMQQVSTLLESWTGPDPQELEEYRNRLQTLADRHPGFGELTVGGL